MRRYPSKSSCCLLSRVVYIPKVSKERSTTSRSQPVGGDARQATPSPRRTPKGTKNESTGREEAWLVPCEEKAPVSLSSSLSAYGTLCLRAAYTNGSRRRARSAVSGVDLEPGVYRRDEAEQSTHEEELLRSGEDLGMGDRGCWGGQTQTGIMDGSTVPVQGRRHLFLVCGGRVEEESSKHVDKG